MTIAGQRRGSTALESTYTAVSELMMVVGACICYSKVEFSVAVIEGRCGRSAWRIIVV